jgi:hypothetical protein
MDRVEKLLEKLVLELTVQRLVTRSIITTMIANSKQSIPHLLDSIEESAAMTSPNFFPLDDVDPELQAKASRIAQARAKTLLANFGKGLKKKPKRHLRLVDKA